MSKDIIKGGKSDKMSAEDIAKKHGVNVIDIEKEIKVGKKVESEHTDSEEKQKEITMDHLVEDPKYYSDPKTGLIHKEKEVEKHLKKMNEESKKMMALAGIKEDDKKFLKNESFSEAEEKKTEPEFITIKFEQEEVEPGEDDDELYTLGK